MRNIFLLLIAITFLSIPLSVQDMSPATRSQDNKTIPSGCTVITISKGGNVFFGGNDDYINPDSYYWVEQGDSSKYGVIWIGTPDNPQQGINEKGLAYDSNGLPRFEVNPHSERMPVSGEYYHNYLMQIMHECSTVTEVIEWANKHQRFPYMHDQMHFADKTGDAVIISAGTDGEMVFTRKESGDGFLVSTNFNIANPSNGYDYPCWRYDKANELLGQMIDKKEPLNFYDVTDVMDAVHQEGASWTIETLVADLTNGIMYLYFFYQYDNPVIINIKDELANPREAGPLSRLFPEDLQQEAAKRYKQVTKVIRINNITGRSWGALIVVSLILMFIIKPQKKGLRFWIPAVIVLGPIALLAKLIALNSGKKSMWRNALIETVGNLTPVVIAYLVSQIVLILKMISGGISEQQQALIIIGLPLLTAWIIFQSPLLAFAGKKNFGRFLFQRLPQVLVTTFLGLAGIFAVSMPLVNKSLAMSQIIPLSPWIVMTWWAITVAGSLIGGFFIFFYEHWAVKRGYQAWNVFAGNEGEIITPKWSKIWWWILISILILFAGLIAGIMILKIL
ncbi:MAG: hypothetical protein A2Y71_05095 [Bacteroidetes bacterium RBG_13_42_15]|nr:MAG: hypothetical protein A2Y71_05095 [Bacteroidetes bacterium RBG_13_42_15]